MKLLILIAAAVTATMTTASSYAHADIGQVICEDEMLADNNTFGGLERALKKLNMRLSTIPAKSVSPPVFLSAATPIIVCVTVTK